MIDTIATYAILGNRSHKSKLEAVRLQIVALRAIEAQLEDWIDQSENENSVELIGTNPSLELMQEVVGAMLSRGLMRADPQSPEWAGLAVPGLAFGEVTSAKRKHARRVIEGMVEAGLIKRVSAFSGRRGREIPSYEVCQSPTCKSAGGKSGEEWGES